MHAVGDPLFLQLMGKKIMAVHVELQAERRPGGDTQITEAQFFVNEIKIIVEAFALVKFKECLSSGLIMPRLISAALFHSRKNVDQPLSFASFPDDFLNPVIFAESSEPAYELDFNAVFICNTLGVRANLFCKGLGEI